MTSLELLEFGKTNRVPAEDLLSQLGFFNDSYQHFLIEVIWYGGYGSADKVLEDLMGAQGINNIWAFLEYESDLEWERRLGIDNFKRSGLQFVDQYLWWEQGLNLPCNGE